MDITRELGFTAGWQERLKKECLEKGSRHKPSGSDYFIYPRACFKNIPDFAIGRAGWDNWMIFESRRQGWKTIDASEEIHIIHQNHDYSHLPGGQRTTACRRRKKTSSWQGAACHIYPGGCQL
jgi:hypothetical protein